MPLNFAAIHTTALTMSNTLIDLLSFPLLPLRNGLKAYMKRPKGVGGRRRPVDQSGTGALPPVRLRHSRKHAHQQLYDKKCAAKSDARRRFREQSGRVASSKGILIRVDMHSAQHDPEIYPDPDTYDAFRFSKSREEADALNVHGGLNGAKSNGLTNTSDIFLAFSHGRHTCPGRFFVSLEMKLLLAYMVMNYEVQPLENRPLNVWYGSTSIPSAKATIKVRRKENTVGK